MNKNIIIGLFLLLHLASIFSNFSEKIIGTTSKGHWEAILIGCLVEVLVLWLYTKALSLYPGKNIVEICKETIGMWGARIVLLPFVLFLFFHLLLQVRYQTIEVNTVLLPNTPMLAILLVFIFLCVYGAWKGIFVIVRASLVLFLIFIPFVLFSMFVSISNFNVRGIFPLWESKASFLFKPDYYVSMLSYSSFLFLGMLPLDKPIPFRKMLPVMLLVAVFGLIAVYVPLMVFGQEASVNLQYPTLMSSDTIDFEWVVFDWLPSFYIVSTSAFGILQAAVLFWMVMTLVRLLYIPINFKWIAGILSVLLFFLCMRITNVHTLNEYFLRSIAFCLYSIIAVPLIIAVLARLNHRKVTN